MLQALDFVVSGLGISGLLIIVVILALIFGGGLKRRILGLLLLVTAMPITSQIAALPLNASTIAYDALGSVSGGAASGGDAVAVYGAGVFADKTGGMWPSERSLARTAVGLELSKRLNLPLIVSGGIVRPDLAAEAIVLADVMRLPAATILEAKARTTAENAQYVAEVLRQRGWRSIILVTSREHTRRALAASLTAGMEVVEVIDSTRGRPAKAADFIPSAHGLTRWSPIVHEYVGILWYLLSGWITPETLYR